MRIPLKYIILPLIGVIAYFLLNYHFVFFGASIKPITLKKAKLTMEDTFVHISKARSIEGVLASETLRGSGVGALLVERGMITQEQLDQIMARYKE